MGRTAEAWQWLISLFLCTASVSRFSFSLVRNLAVMDYLEWQEMYKRRVSKGRNSSSRGNWSRSRQYSKRDQIRFMSAAVTYGSLTSIATATVLLPETPTVGSVPVGRSAWIDFASPFVEMLLVLYPQKVSCIWGNCTPDTGLITIVVVREEKTLLTAKSSWFSTEVSRRFDTRSLNRTHKELVGAVEDTWWSQFES